MHLALSGPSIIRRKRHERVMNSIMGQGINTSYGETAEQKQEIEK
jgi:hypothetical protein